VSNDCYTYLKKVTGFCVTSVLCKGWYEGSLIFAAVTSTNSSFIHGEATSCQCQPNPLSKILIVLCIDNFILSSVQLHSPSQASALWPDGLTFLFVWMCFVQHGSLLHWKPQSRTSYQHQILCKDAEIWNVTISLNGQISVSGISIPRVLALSRSLLNNTQND